MDLADYLGDKKSSHLLSNCSVHSRHLSLTTSDSPSHDPHLMWLVYTSFAIMRGAWCQLGITLKSHCEQLLILRVSTWTNRLGSSLFGQTRGPPPSPRQASLPRMIVLLHFSSPHSEVQSDCKNPSKKDRNANCTTFLPSCADKGLIEAEPGICIT